jgi:hypothetical protein
MIHKPFGDSEALISSLSFRTAGRSFVVIVMLAKSKLCTLAATCILTVHAIVPLPAGAGFRLLDQLGERAIEGSERFVAADAFKIGSTIGGRPLSAVGPGFAKHFLGVVELDVPPISLGIWALQYTAGDTSLVKALGGERSAVVPFLAGCGPCIGQ